VSPAVGILENMLVFLRGIICGKQAGSKASHQDTRPGSNLFA